MTTATRLARLERLGPELRRLRAEADELERAALERAGSGSAEALAEAVGLMGRAEDARDQVRRALGRPARSVSAEQAEAATAAVARACDLSREDVEQAVAEIVARLG
jgi:hypothetical protein